MRLVLADVQQDALNRAAAELSAAGADVLAIRVDVSKAADVEALGRATRDRFGAPHLVFNNAGVVRNGLVWEASLKDWEWVFGVNVMGVAHGIRVFAPMMLEAARADAAYRGHIVNTASMAGLLNPPNMAVYNASKHAVVSISETLYHDLALVTDQIGASVLCPFFVATGINQSDRNRPPDLRDVDARPTVSQRIGHEMNEKAVGSGKVSASDVARLVFDSVARNQFYVYSHPRSLKSVQTRMEDVIQSRNPSDPLADKPQLVADLKKALR